MSFIDFVLYKSRLRYKDWYRVTNYYRVKDKKWSPHLAFLGDFLSSVFKAILEQNEKWSQKMKKNYPCKLNV